MSKAVRTDWKTLPLPSMRQDLGLELFLSDAEGEQIQLGFVPQEMEDKWFIFFEDGWLYFHRSWTGACIYGIKFDGSPSGVRATESWVNADPSQYKGSDRDFDRKLVLYFINKVLLRKPAEFPREIPRLEYSAPTVSNSNPPPPTSAITTNQHTIWEFIRNAIFRRKNA